MSLVSTLREKNFADDRNDFFRRSIILVNFAVHQIDDTAKNKCILVGEGSQERQSVCYTYNIIIFHVCFIPLPIPKCIAKSSNAISSISKGNFSKF